VQSNGVTDEKNRYGKRQVEVDLIEQTPGNGALGHWLLASPMLLFIAWLWIDIVNYYSPLPRAVDYVLASLFYIAVVVLPLGLLTQRIVTAAPRLFHHAGWDVQPRSPVRPEEQYMVNYVYCKRYRAPFSWRSAWTRAGQGWVYLEIAAIFVGAVAMVPLFFSATDFGFGR
jgi:hypothetical protein